MFRPSLTTLAQHYLIGAVDVFELERFITDCRAAQAQAGGEAVREVVARAVSDLSSVIKALGEPQTGQIRVLYHAPDLTILNVVWAPRMLLLPHNHARWGVHGIYAGREDHIFWRRLPNSAAGKVEAASAQSLSEKDARFLGSDFIHSVINPIDRPSGAIHVYGDDYFNANRSEWDPETLLERRCDPDRLARLFGERNA
jgi:predicted metal-dependent enzyme (double-stranded beta helix superfamily)